MLNSALLTLFKELNIEFLKESVVFNVAKAPLL